jgi:GT2 family glycosyltransferase
MPSKAGLRLSVVIPTYQRPDWIRRAVLSLAAQDPVPMEVIAVARDTDHPTHEAIAALQAESLPFPLLQGVVRDPGFMPPVREGVRLATGDVIAVMDDDAEALAGWTHGLLKNYADPRVGGVGGRYINMEGDREIEVPKARRVGYVSVLGRFVGDMYKRPTFSVPVDVEFLLGGCMSYRREVVRSLQFDLGLNNNVAFGYEVDLGLQVRARGWRLVFDPAVAVHHYSAPRSQAGMRKLDDGQSVFWYAYNQTRVLAGRLSGPHRLLALVWSCLVGERRAPGVIPWLLSPLSRRVGFQAGIARHALKGRARAVRDTVAAHRKRKA